MWSLIRNYHGSISNIWKENVLRTFFSKAKRVFKLPTLLTLYYSFIYLFRLYSIEIWGSASKECLMYFLTLQQRAVRNRISANASIIWITICIWNIYIQMAILICKYVHNKVADCVNALITGTNEIHNRVTRQSDKFYILFSRLSTYVNLCVLKVLSYGTQFVMMLMFFVVLVHSNYIWKIVY